MPGGERIRATRSRRAAYLEALESRELMAFDYAITLGTDTLDDHQVQGFAGAGKLQVILTNNAGTPSPAAKADIRVYARPNGALDASGDVEIGKLLNQPYNIVLHNSKGYPVQLNVPNTLAADSYDYFVMVKAASSGPEISELDQPSMFVVDPQRIDVKAEILSVNAPASAISGGPSTGTAVVRLTNNGNVPIPAGHNPGALITLDNASKSFTAGGMGINITNLAPKGFKNATIKIFFDDSSVTTGAYHFGVFGGLDPGPNSDVDMSNNTDALDGKTINITQGFVDFAVAIAPGTFPDDVIQGTTPPTKLKFIVKNVGNIPVAQGSGQFSQTFVTLSLLARPVGGGEDIPVGLPLTNQIVSGLGIGKSKSFDFTADLKSLPVGDFNLIVKVACQTQNLDTNAGNDEAPASHAISVQAPFIDLVGEASSSTLTGTVAGLRTGTFKLDVTNAGNIVAVGYKVEVFATENGTITPGSVLLGSVSTDTGTINPQATAHVSVPIMTPGPAVAKDYVLVAKITALPRRMPTSRPTRSSPTRFMCSRQRSMTPCWVPSR